MTIELKPSKPVTISRSEYNWWCMTPGTHGLPWVIKKAVDLFGHVIECGETLTPYQFAKRILEVSTCVQALAIVDEIHWYSESGQKL